MLHYSEASFWKEVEFLVRLLFGMYMRVYILLYVYNIIFSQTTSFFT